MSTPTRNLSFKASQGVNRWPCDGIRRFKVAGIGAHEPVTYSAAYEGICAAEGVTKNADGGRHFTREGLRRITRLNETYTRVAKQFLAHKIATDLHAAIQAQKQNPKPETNPTDDSLPISEDGKPRVFEARAAPDPVPAG